MTNRNYYEILGLMPGADGALVDQSYWHLARRYQTQADSDPRARAQLDDLNEAYGVLGTPRLREQYDAFTADVAAVRGRGRSATRRRTRSVAASGAGFLSRLKSALRPATRPEAEAPAVSAVQDDEPQLVGARVRSQQRPSEVSAGDLHSSTTALIGRWRNTVGVKTAAGTDRTPDMTLVDIFQSEHQVEEPSEPLFAAIDILRGSKQPVDSR